MRSIISVIVFLVVFGGVVHGFSVGQDFDLLVFCENEQTKIVRFVLSGEGSVRVRSDFDSVTFISGSSIGSDLVVDLNGSKRVVSAVVTPRDRSYGESVLEVFFESENGFVESRVVKVFLKNCHSISFTGVFNKSTCLLTPVEFPVVVKNTGRFDESLRVKLEGDGSEFARVSFDNIVVPVSGNKTVYVFFYPTVDDGDFSLVLSVFNDFVSESVRLNVSVGVCNDFGFVPHQELSVCEGDVVSGELFLENNGTSGDEYFINVSSGLKYELSDSSVSLLPGENYSFVVNYTPQCGEVGVFGVNFSVGASRAVKTFFDSSKVSVRDCFSFDSVVNDSDLVVCACENRTVNLTVFNNGLFSQDYKVEVSDGLVSPVSKVRVNPNSSVSLGLLFNECSPDSFNEWVHVFELSDCGGSVEKRLSFKVLSSKECRHVSVVPGIELAEFEANKQYVIPITVKNEGVKQAEYDVVFSGSASGWVHSVSEDSFILSPGESKTVTALVITPLNIVSDNYELVVNVLSSGEIISGSRISFKRDVERLIPQVVNQPQSSAPTPFDLLPVVVLLGVFLFLLGLFVGVWLKGYKFNF